MPFLLYFGYFEAFTVILYIIDQSVSTDGYYCVTCNVLSQRNTDSCEKCPKNYIQLNTISKDGSLIEQNCLKCPNGKRPSDDGTLCIPCIEGDDSCICQVCLFYK